MTKVQLITRLEQLHWTIDNECEQDIHQSVQRIIEIIKDEGITRKKIK